MLTAAGAAEVKRDSFPGSWCAEPSSELILDGKSKALIDNHTQLFCVRCPQFAHDISCNIHNRDDRDHQYHNRGSHRVLIHSTTRA